MNKLISPVAGIQIEAITFDGAAGPSLPTAEDGATGGGINMIAFAFSVTGSAQAVSQVIQNIEHSIRQIDITLLTINVIDSDPVSGEAITLGLTATAQAYYTTPVSIALGSEEVKSGGDDKASTGSKVTTEETTK
jgi:hypothetical protein